MRAMIVLMVLILAGCESVEMEVFEIEAKNGETIKLKCPTLSDGDRFSPFVIYESNCYLIK